MAVKSEAVKAKIDKSIRDKEKRQETYDERKSRALAEGNKYLYLVCPLCSRNKPLKTHLKGWIRFKVYDNPEIIQARYGIGGRGIAGFFKKDEECIRLDRLKEEYPDVYENLKAEVKKLYEMLQVRV